HELCSVFLSDRSRRSILASDWAGQTGQVAAERDVYVCEAFGGASPYELRELFSAIGSTGGSVILVWTDDWPWPFPASADPRLMIFELSRADARCCSYGWDTRKFGPGSITSWPPFAERDI